MELYGELGIRTPGPVTVNSFFTESCGQDCPNRPLCRLSGRKIPVGFLKTKRFCIILKLMNGEGMNYRKIYSLVIGSTTLNNAPSFSSEVAIIKPP